MKGRYPTKKVFIVEDDETFVRIIKYIVELDPELEPHVFSTGKDCIDHLYLNPYFITLDYSLPDTTGTEVLKAIKAYDENIGVIILSGQDDVTVAIELMKSEPFDYIFKNLELKDKLILSISKLKETLNLKEEVQDLKNQLGKKYTLESELIGNSSPMDKVYRLIHKAIKTNITVSIYGETGTGKELVARTIHYNSNQSQGRLVAVNVSAIPKDLLESELFGYEKGAFTGANTRKIGKFELANNGTLFLDEIAEMDINLQAKLLRAIQEKEITRIGGTEVIKFNARIIIATHRDLVLEVERGNFREDLYYRLLGLTVELPPLRDRGEDIILLADHFLKEFCKNNRISNKTFSDKAIDKMMHHHFPGNVRELKAIVDLAATLAEGDIVEDGDIKFKNLRSKTFFLNKEMTLKEYNKTIINQLLDKYENDVLLVAKKLGIGKSTIYRMLKEVKEEPIQKL